MAWFVVYINLLELLTEVLLSEHAGEGVEADMLIEYMLYLTSEQEHGASTSVR